jgi:hypothetical protein
MATNPEPDAILAVFETPAQAHKAVRQLSEVVADPRFIIAVPLPPGRHPLAAVNPSFEAYAAVRGAALGAPLGAVVGLALALLLAGATPFPAIGATAAGALAGLALGGRRALVRSRWSDTGKGFLDVPERHPYVLVTIPASASSDRRVRRALGSAIAFLEPRAYFATHEIRPVSNGTLAGPT